MLIAWCGLVTGQSLDALAGCGALTLVFVLVFLLALWIDARWGEPRPTLHPVVAMGRYLQACGRVTVSLPPALAFVLGGLAWWLGVLVTGVLAWGLQALVLQQMVRLVAEPGPAGALLALLLVALMAWLLKSMLSWRMLHDEVGAVEAALQQSLGAGRERLSWLVSRNTVLLDESEVRESVIESLAENLNDSVVAPIFWFVLFGLPGAAIYRFANTADAMWGYRGMYKGEHWEWAGKWAARADDVLSWLPARLTALLLALVAGGLSFKALRHEAGKTPSPNSGWPMAAMALALGVSLRKPGVYTLNPEGNPPQASDTVLAQNYAAKVVLALFVLVSSALILIALARPWS
ncbi:MAG: adenosylcobinamide-phosphate synthase CbiB [Polaromonas sp.]|nr:adenosylcobinamide-phosphate synthase CbiB [Polaromonas sp.]MDP3797630.1 adenosylcobinamide-phosphate synthase CbiB [Polaromonas sp.]